MNFFEKNKKKILAGVIGFLVAIFLITIAFISKCEAADVALNWDAAQFATGYRLQMSTDNGVTWTAGVDVGNVFEYTLLGVPDTGMVLFRVVAYNSNAWTINSWSGAWYNGDWQPPRHATGLGVR